MLIGAFMLRRRAADWDVTLAQELAGAGKIVERWQRNDITPHVDSDPGADWLDGCLWQLLTPRNIRIILDDGWEVGPHLGGITFCYYSEPHALLIFKFNLDEDEALSLLPRILTRIPAGVTVQHVAAQRPLHDYFVVVPLSPDETVRGTVLIPYDENDVCCPEEHLLTDEQAAKVLAAAGYS